MSYATLHFAPSARGSGDGSTAANAAALFPSGNWSSLLTANNYATQGMVALCQNTAKYTCSQQGSSSTFTSGTPTSTTYPLILLAADENGNVISPVNQGWKCAEGNIDVLNFCEMDYTLTTGNLSVSTNIHINCFKINATTNTAAILNSFHGIISNCFFNLTSSSASGLGLILTTITGGLVNSHVHMEGAAYARIISASTAGLLSNVRVTANPAASSGTLYGIAITSSTLVTIINGPVFIKDVAGIGMTNYSANLSAGISASRCTIVDCAVGVGCLTPTSGGSSKIVLTDSVVTGCTVGLGHPYGRYTLRNVVLRNTTNVSPDSENYVASPLVEVTTETDAQLYAAAASGDYRIKDTSDHWGKNRGAQDHPFYAGPNSSIIIVED